MIPASHWIVWVDEEGAGVRELVAWVLFSNGVVEPYETDDDGLCMEIDSNNNYFIVERSTYPTRKEVEAALTGDLRKRVEEQQALLPKPRPKLVQRA